jgi:NADH-quinone oxidoreductase subunit G
LLGRIARHLGTANIDHRVRSRDFRDQDNDPKAPWLGIDVAALDVQQGVLVVGSNLRMEVPIFAHRLRKAALKGAAVAFVNPASYTYHFPLAAEIAASLDGLLPAPPWAKRPMPTTIPPVPTGLEKPSPPSTR